MECCLIELNMTIIKYRTECCLIKLNTLCNSFFFTVYRFGSSLDGRHEVQRRIVRIGGKIEPKPKIMEMRGIDPRTSRMLSERSTIWATSPDGRFKFWGYLFLTICDYWGLHYCSLLDVWWTRLPSVLGGPSGDWKHWTATNVVHARPSRGVPQCNNASMDLQVWIQ
jgi:hypothetical protein